MRTLRNPYIIVATLFLSALGFLILGCRGLVKVKPGADPIVVVAQWTSENSLNAIDQFLAWEHQHRASLTNKLPGVVATAVSLRKDDAAKKEAENLRALTKQYQSDKTAANGERVKAASNALLALANSVLAHMGVPPLQPPVITPGAVDLMQHAPTNGPPSPFSEVLPPSR